MAHGFCSLPSSTTAEDNTASGAFSMRNTTTGGANVAIGQESMCGNSTGCQNTALGSFSLHTNTSGAYNVAVGRLALRYNTTGDYNVAVGRRTGESVTTGENNILIGREAGISGSPFTVTTQDNRIVLGDNSITNFYARVALTVTSDARDKTEIADVPHGLDFVDKLKPVSFKFKKSREDDTPHGDVRYGFKAQDILALEGENNVIIDTEQPDHLKYKGEHLVPVLVNAIKELTARVKELEND